MELHIGSGQGVEPERPDKRNPPLRRKATKEHISCIFLQSQELNREGQTEIVRNRRMDNKMSITM